MKSIRPAALSNRHFSRESEMKKKQETRGSEDEDVGSCWVKDKWHREKFCTANDNPITSIVGWVGCCSLRGNSNVWKKFRHVPHSVINRT